MLALGATTKLTVGTTDITQWVTKTEPEFAREAKDVTTYGNTAVRRLGGLFDHKLSVEGFYDDETATAAHGVLMAAYRSATPVAVEWETEKTNFAGDVVVSSYKVSQPTAEIRTWTATFEFDGDITETPVTFEADSEAEQ